MARALSDGGVRAFELTLNDPEAEALRSIEAVATVASASRPRSRCRDHPVDRGRPARGRCRRDVPGESAPGRGTRGWAAGRGIPAFPGCATPTEVLAAWRAGAAAIKVFPASVLGPAFVRELRGPFPDIPVVPTGGVTVETAPSFIAAGAVAVGMGGWLVGDGATAGVRERAGRIVAAVAAARAANTR